ncbi:MAG: serine O-acetyltransferase EpsC [Clostridia bacterium]|nr:serine O-acetyltransferase EpsC [Clostridia bacterium]
MFDLLKEDIKAIKDRDPAAKSTLEILLLYPGLKAVRMHRRAHKHYLKGHSFRARYISQRAAKKTGIEIHPGATIGRRLVIDHGTGIVIGETAEIGDDVLIYQGVTLGGTGKDVGKRHPTVCNGVMISAGSKVLGPITIGENSRVAAGAVVLKDVPPNSTVVGVPARVVRQNGKKVERAPLDQIHISDPVQQELDALKKKLKSLEDKIKE